jgi:serine phosphatase RsbU (regulator of sigma subunit)
VPVLVIGWIRQLVVAVTVGPSSFPIPASMEGWLLLIATVTYFLLVLELRDKLSLKGDLEIARQIQFGLLPFEPYAAGGTSVVSAMRPANTVGGDYFDVIELGEGRVALVVGDVAGKGMPAALLMAMLQGSLRTLLSAGLRGPELLAKLNTHLCANIPSNRLITLFYGELDPARGALRWVNAGHNFPFLLRGDGGLARLDASGMALGVAPEAAFEERESALGAGDRLFLFTDGVTEAANARDEEYGEERLTAYLLAHRASPHRELIDGVFEDVLRFCGSVRPRDDMTVMSVGRDG